MARRHARALPLILAALALTGCAGGQSVSGGPVTGGPTEAVSTTGGEALLRRACTVCHSLRALPAYADYWGEPEWLSMVDTMIGYGAVVTAEEMPVLVRYLAVNYGTEEPD